MFGDTPIFSSPASGPTMIQRAVALSKGSPYFFTFGWGLFALGLLCNYLLAGRRTTLRWDMEVTATALVLVVAGLLLVLHALRPQLSDAVHFALAIVSVTIYGLIYAYTLGLLILSSSGDYGHCEDMIENASATAPLPPAAFDPMRKAVFCLEGNYGLFRTRYQILEVYGITDRATQDAILQQLDRVRHVENTEAIQVLFYEKENVRLWKNSKNGASGGERGPESLLRIALIQ